MEKNTLKNDFNSPKYLDIAGIDASSQNGFLSELTSIESQIAAMGMCTYGLLDRILILPEQNTPIAYMVFGLFLGHAARLATRFLETRINHTSLPIYDDLSRHKESIYGKVFDTSPQNTLIQDSMDSIGLSKIKEESLKNIKIGTTLSCMLGLGSPMLGTICFTTLVASGLWRYAAIRKVEKKEWALVYMPR